MASNTVHPVYVCNKYRVVEVLELQASGSMSAAPPSASTAGTFDRWPAFVSLFRTPDQRTVWQVRNQYIVIDRETRAVRTLHRGIVTLIVESGSQRLVASTPHITSDMNLPATMFESDEDVDYSLFAYNAIMRAIERSTT